LEFEVQSGKRRTKSRTQYLLLVSLQMFGVPSPARAVLFQLQFYILSDMC
jgi:hypothetical protein